MSAVVQIKAHTRKGKQVKAHKRTYGGVSAHNYLKAIRGGKAGGSELAARKKSGASSNAHHILGAEGVKKSMYHGFHIHSSGNIVHYDKDRKDHYIHPNMRHTYQHGPGSNIEKHGDSPRMYFKKNPLHKIKKFME